jgi:putative acetyltransferase
MNLHYEEFLIRDWQPDDRTIAYELIGTVLAEYGLVQEPEGADRDVLEIEASYLDQGGEFWVIVNQNKLVGTAAFYPIPKGKNAVEIRKMYLLPEARGKGLGKFLLHQLEQIIWAKGFEQIFIETASVLKEAVQLYERNGYQPVLEVETQRCDRAYVKSLTPSF